MTQLALALKVVTSPIDRALLEDVVAEWNRRNGSARGREILSRLLETEQESALELAYRRLDSARLATPPDPSRVASALEEVRALQAIEVERMRARSLSADELTLEGAAASLERARRLLEGHEPPTP